MPQDQRENGHRTEGVTIEAGNGRIAGELAAPTRRAGVETVVLDATNRLILDELQADARLTLAELGRRVGLSSPAVADRVQRLERDGVITGYRAEVDPLKVGFQLAVVIRIRPAARQIPKVAELVRGMPEIVECNRITGEDCYVMKAYVRSVEHLEEIIDQLVLYGSTTTSIVQSSPVPRRAVPLADG
jgi:Lrp/AsnC family transcriptional regulator, leucine-responsive regulatory protein